jgi:hypothetical protein
VKKERAQIFRSQTSAHDISTSLVHKEVKATPTDLTYHPNVLLEHIVNDIISKVWTDTAGKRVMYQDVVDDPEAAITKMKELVNSWVIEYYEAGILYAPELYVMNIHTMIITILLTLTKKHLYNVV